LQVYWLVKQTISFSWSWTWSTIKFWNQMIRFNTVTIVNINNANGECFLGNYFSWYCRTQYISYIMCLICFYVISRLIYFFFNKFELTILTIIVIKLENVYKRNRKGFLVTGYRSLICFRSMGNLDLCTHYNPSSFCSYSVNSERNLLWSFLTQNVN